MLDDAPIRRASAHVPEADAGGWQRLSLETISPESANALNGVFRVGRTAPLRIGGRSLRLRPAWVQHEPVVADPWTVTIDAGDWRADWIVPHKLLALALVDADPGLRLTALSDAMRPLVVEYAMRDALQSLEAALGFELAIRSVAVGHATAMAGHATLAFRAELDGAAHGWCLLRLPAEHLGGAADSLTALADAAHPRTQIPVPVCLRWAAMELTREDLQSLAPGDIVLVDASCGQPGLGVAVIGEHLAAPVELLRSGYRVAGQPRRAAASSFYWSLDLPALPRADLADASPGQIPLRVLFELGRFEMERGAVAQLSAGAVLDLVRPLEEGLDIVVGGSTIGRGEVVTLGNAIGVRITRL